MRVTMEDVQGGGKSEIVTTEMRRDVALPASLFDPNGLSAVATESTWISAAPSASSTSSGS